MNGDEIINGRVCRHHNRIGADFITSRGSNAGVFSTFDFVCMRAGEYLAAIALDRARQSRQVFQRMELALSRKMQTWTRIKTFEWSTLQPAYCSQTGALRSR